MYIYICIQLIYPGVPVELVVSLGTGFYNKNSNVQSMDWSLLVRDLVGYVVYALHVCMHACTYSS